MNKMSNIIVAIVLALGAIISMAIIANAIEKNNISNKTITVRGNAIKEFKIKDYSFDVTIYVNSKDLNSVLLNLLCTEPAVIVLIKYWP